MANKGRVKSSGILLVHALIVLCVGCLMLFVRYILQPVKRGFFCGDTSIRLPYRPSSIPFSIFSLVTFPIVVLTIILSELYVRSRKLKCYEERYEISGRILDPTLIRMIQFFLVFLLDLREYINCLVLILFVLGWFASSVKNTIGQLRPHFLDVCKPNVDLNNCSSSEFIDNYVCSQPETSDKVIDSRLSFFSGHSSSAFYCAAFLAIYLHARVGRFEVSWTPIFALIYSILFVSAALVGISRILDHKHHSSDVVAGACVGIIMACLMLYCNQHLLIARRTSFGRNYDKCDRDDSEEYSSQSDNKDVTVRAAEML